MLVQLLVTDESVDLRDEWERNVIKADGVTTVSAFVYCPHNEGHDDGEDAVHDADVSRHDPLIPVVAESLLLLEAGPANFLCFSQSFHAGNLTEHYLTL